MTRPVWLAVVVVAACGSDGGGRGPGVASPDSARGASDAAGVSAAACFEAWRDPVEQVTATSRPAPAASPAMRINFTYQVTAGAATIVLDDIAAETIALDSEGPFSPNTHSGSWVELRDDADATLYTRQLHTLIPESVEAPAGGGGFTNAYVCPEEGGVRLTNLANVAGATQIVFFQEPVDGVTTSRTIELARFRLP